MSVLHAFATSNHDAVRLVPASVCPLRNAFQRDRDRILHSKAFRRLMHKTQVFVAPQGDHDRTRLTHTLEVSQIARTISRALCLNEDLTEAIALGHDLGHPPFAHQGEVVLNQLSETGFQHTRHSLRLVEVLEPLALTQQTLAGLAYQAKKPTQTLTETPYGSPPIEAQVVEWADRIAYLHHDWQDAQRAGLVTDAALPADLRQILGETYPQRLKTMVCAAVSASTQQFAQGQACIAMPPDITQAVMALRQWMFAHVYLHASQAAYHLHISTLLTTLWQHYQQHPMLLPPQQSVLDYIAGMTDRFAEKQYAAIENANIKGVPA